MTESTTVTPYASGQLVKAALLASRDLTRTERDVMVTIAAHGNGMGDAWPSVETIAEYVGKSARTVQRTLAKLVNLGRLVARARRGASTVYRLATSAINAVISGGNVRQIGPQGVTAVTTTPDTRGVSPEVGSKSLQAPKGRSAPDAASRRRWFPRQHQNPGWTVRQGAANPPAADVVKCPRHLGQLAHNCGGCRGDALVGDSDGLSKAVLSLRSNR